VGNGALVETADPEIKDDEVLMKVWAAGVCGSDLLIQEDRHMYTAPVTIGHEYSGIVVDVGKNVTRVKPGDRIVSDIETKEAWLGVSRTGSYAPLMAIPEEQVYVFSQDVSLDHMCFAEPVVATLHSMQERSRVKVGDFVTVVGPGPMGLLGVEFAKLCGAKAVALIGLKDDEKRLGIGRRVGADYILYSDESPEKQILDLTHGRGSDFVLECSASEKGVQHAMDCARKSPEGYGGNGTISFISLWGRPIKVNLDALSLYQLSVNGSWSWNGRETWERAVDLIERGVLDLDSLITNHYKLEEWELAFANLRSKQDVKAFLHPNGRGWA
jgi:L-iditol 2-dehydrogenase